MSDDTRADIIHDKKTIYKLLNLTHLTTFFRLGKLH